MSIEMAFPFLALTFAVGGVLYIRHQAKKLDAELAAARVTDDR